MPAWAAPRNLEIATGARELRSSDATCAPVGTTVDPFGAAATSRMRA
ncbi:hypothetical protein [Sorangium sp. So ce542]